MTVPSRRLLARRLTSAHATCGPLATATLVALAMLTACRADAPTGPALEDAPVTINAALAGTEIRALSVLVSGPAITTPIVANVEVAADVTTATLTMQVPVGGQRTFVARGFDATGELTHEGMATAVVRPGNTPPVAVRMYPKTSEVPVTVGVGTLAIEIDPSPLPVLAVGQGLQLSATVRDGASVLSGATVRWGSLNPIVATVTPTGMVIPRLMGTTTIYAMSGGSAASADLTVGTGPAPAMSFREITASEMFTCALDQSGRAWCWGYGAYGQLGDAAARVLSTRPVQTVPNLRFTALSAGRLHICGLTAEQEVWCWGFNDTGALGNGQSGNVPIPPQRVLLSTLRATSVAAGPQSTCAVLTTGQGACWGSGIEGNIGLTSDAQGQLITVPRFVTVGTGSWASFDLGYLASCGVRPSGHAACSTRGGSLVTTASAQGVSWRSLQVTDMYWTPGFGAFGWNWDAPAACGLTTTGEVRCWGTGLFGELGTGAAAASLGAPTTVQGAQGFSAITLGARFACALRDGSAFCWGHNANGQLGDGSLVNRSAPTAVLGGITFSQISAGFHHACGLRTGDGAAFCWGLNAFGEVGDGTRAQRTSPVAVLAPAAATP